MFKKYSEKNSGGLTLKHKIGYGLGDAGGCMTFAIMGSTFAMYCTDALKIDTVLLGILLAVWRIYGTLSMTPLWEHCLTNLLQKTIIRKESSAHGFFEVRLLYV